MSSYSAILAARAGLPEARCEEIRLASPMHDIGKLGIPDAVLTHPGLFDADQRAVMNQHTTYGWEILHGSDSALLETAAVIAVSHHEWWDGRGYLAGTAIPIENRIVAIAARTSTPTCSTRSSPTWTSWRRYGRASPRPRCPRRCDRCGAGRRSLRGQRLRWRGRRPCPAGT